MKRYTMRRKTSTYIITSTLILLMFLTACSSRTQPNVTSTATNSTSAVSTGPAMVGDMYVEGLPIVKEPKTFTIAYNKHSLDTGNTSDKYILKLTEEETNIKFKINDIPQSEWKTKVNLLFASNELPDVIMGNTIDIVANKDSLVAVDELIAKYAPNLQATLDKYPAIKGEQTFPDGHMYSLFTSTAVSPTNEVAGLLTYNVEMLEATGLPVPTTTEELYAVLKKVKELNPDVIPLSLCESNWSTKLLQMMAPWGILDSVAPAINEKGVVYLDAMTDAFYDCLKYYNRLASEGLFDPESFSQTYEQLRSKGASGKLFLVLDVRPSATVGEQLAGKYEYLYPVQGPNGIRMWHGQNNKNQISRDWLVITKACKTPEVIIRWVDYCNSSLEKKLITYYGERGGYWDMDDKGWWYGSTFAAQNGLAAEAMWSLGFVGLGPAYLTAEDWGRLDYDRLSEAYRIKDREINKVRGLLPKENQFYPRAFEEPEKKQERDEIGVDIQTYLKEFIATSILKGIDDAKWQQHLNTLKSMSIDKWIAMYQEFYDTFAIKTAK